MTTSYGFNALSGKSRTLNETTTDVIRLHPDTVFTWGVEPGTTGMTPRETTDELAVDL